MLGVRKTKDCDGCGVSLPSNANYCLACYAERIRDCPECLSAAGRLRGDYKFDRGEMPMCKTCNNKRTIFVEPARGKAKNKSSREDAK